MLEILVAEKFIASGAKPLFLSTVKWPFGLDCKKHRPSLSVAVMTVVLFEIVHVLALIITVSALMDTLADNFCLIVSLEFKTCCCNSGANSNASVIVTA